MKTWGKEDYESNAKFYLCMLWDRGAEEIPPKMQKEKELGFNSHWNDL